MPPIGETLREARMRQGLDIADVEERTKIRAKYLRALENEEWTLLPGPTFVRTFLRTYAEVVGIDPHLLVEEFRVNHERREEVDFQPLASPPRTRESARRRQARSRGPRRPPGVGALIAGVAVLVVGFILVLGLLGGDDDGDPQDAADTRTETATTPARRPERKPAPRGVRLRITPQGPTYACVDNGAGTDVVFEGTLDAARSFRHPRRVRVNLGLRAVGMRANGKPVDIPPSGDPIGYDVTRRGARELALGDRPCA